MEALYYKALWWVLEVVTHLTFIACIIGIGMAVLWVAGRLSCRECMQRERNRKKLLKLRVKQALENPVPRSETMPIKEWTDYMIRQFTRPPVTHSCENQGCGSSTCESCGPYEARKTEEYLEKYRQLITRERVKNESQRHSASHLQRW